MKSILFFDYLRVTLDEDRNSDEVVTRYDELDEKQKQPLSDVLQKMEHIHRGLQHLSEKTKHVIRASSWFSRQGYWYIWPTMKALGVSSFEVFCELTQSVPSGMGALAFKKNLDVSVEFQALTKGANPTQCIYVDYWNGLAFKMHLPVDMNRASRAALERSVEYRRYDDRNPVSLAARIGHLLQQKENSQNPSSLDK